MIREKRGIEAAGGRILGGTRGGGGGNRGNNMEIKDGKAAGVNELSGKVIEEMWKKD